MASEIDTIGSRMDMARTIYKMKTQGEKESYSFDTYDNIDLIIIDEIDLLKLQHLEQLRDLYDRNDIAMRFIGMPGIEKQLARYLQLFSRIGFSHEFDNLSKDETHHILDYKWEELGLSIKL